MGVWWKPKAVMSQEVYNQSAIEFWSVQLLGGTIIMNSSVMGRRPQLRVAVYFKVILMTGISCSLAGCLKNSYQSCVEMQEEIAERFLDEATSDTFRMVADGFIQKNCGS